MESTQTWFGDEGASALATRRRRTTESLREAVWSQGMEPHLPPHGQVP